MQTQPMQTQPMRTRAETVTETSPFITLELLLEDSVPQTWRHELESFLYALIWVSMSQPYQDLETWCHALKDKTFAQPKRDDMSQSFDKRILQEFKRGFEEVKPVARRFKEILFYDLVTDPHIMYLGTPQNYKDRIMIYDKVNAAFEDGLENEGWVLVE